MDEDRTDGNKSSHHALIQCPRARDLRQAMGQHWLLSDDERFQYTGKDGLLLLLDSYSKEQRDLILFLRWRAWYVHNNITHGTGPTSTTKSVGFLLNLRESLIKSREPIPKGRLAPGRPPEVRVPMPALDYVSHARTSIPRSHKTKKTARPRQRLGFTCPCGAHAIRPHAGTAHVPSASHTYCNMCNTDLVLKHPDTTLVTFV